MNLTLRIAQTDQLLPEQVQAISALCEAAFSEPWAGAWERIGPGLHVVAEADGRPIAHAMVIDRRLYLGHESDQALDVGYVEWVAAHPGDQGRGHGTAVMREIGRIIGDEYTLGALATSSNSFYERLGWETWLGPTSIRMPDGERVRSATEDGHVMILRTPRTDAALDLEGPIAVDWRADEPW